MSRGTAALARMRSIPRDPSYTGWTDVGSSGAASSRALRFVCASAAVQGREQKGLAPKALGPAKGIVLPCVGAAHSTHGTNKLNELFIIE
jgi:hypothetical protein